MGTSTPWGMANYSKQIAPGIMSYGTPSHGGFHLSPVQNAKVPARYRHAYGWYEEDCGWSAVVLTFPQFFPNVSKEDVKNMLPHWEGWLHRIKFGR